MTIAGEDVAQGDDLPIAPAVLGSVLQPGFDVLIDDGAVRLRVVKVDRGRARCEVLVGGIVTSHKGVNLPGVALPIPSLTRKDIDDLQFALELGVDFVALSFVRSASDVQALKTLIEASGSTAHVIAKIEKAEAVAALDDILRDADCVMVARGDLGVEIGAAEVPLLQKRIILRALERGKPVITATQMLESMIHAPEPTRAEASDVANAVLDGTSALMLSGETAVGEFPFESVAYMDRIARAVEPSLGYRHEIPEAEEKPTVGQAMSNAACDIAEALEAGAILVPTFTGRTASAVARLRPRRPIIGLTHHDYSLQHMALEWGVTPVSIPECADVEELWATSLAAAVGTADRREGRPRRDHRRHGREHPRLDERDQGRHRLGGTVGRLRNRSAWPPAGQPAPRPARHGEAARPAADDGGAALVHRRRRALRRVPLLPAALELPADAIGPERARRRGASGCGTSGRGSRRGSPTRRR